jgi:hypothetical protein
MIGLRLFPAVGLVMLTRDRTVTGQRRPIASADAALRVGADARRVGAQSLRGRGSCRTRHARGCRAWRDPTGGADRDGGPIAR